MTEVGSVKDSFRLCGRREENQREVKEPEIGFRGTGASRSGDGLLLFRTGIAGDGVVRSGGVLTSTGLGLGRCKRELGGGWL